MNPRSCERELEVASAVRASLCSVELSEHVDGCAICAEARQVTEKLLHYAAALRTGQEPARVDRVWRLAQARRQEMILKRAQRPLIFMRLLSLGCAVIFAAWFLRDFSGLGYPGWLRAWDFVGLGAASTGAGIAVLCIAMGAWYLIHEGKRSGGIDVASL